MELDKWTGGVKDFYNSVTRDHPDIAQGVSIDNYVTRYYKTHNIELNDALTRMKNDWLEIEKRFFAIVDKLFGTPWPEGKYICYLSIFNCNPRFIPTKDFQAFYKHPAGTNYVCCHEMLHFIFYDYFEKNFGGENWKLSEIFNDVVLRLPEFVAITHQKDPAIYAETQQELNDGVKLWQEAGSVKKFVTGYLLK